MLIRDVIDINTRTVMPYAQLQQKVGPSANFWLQYRVVYVAVSSFLRNNPFRNENIDSNILFFNDEYFQLARMFRQFISEQEYSEPCAKHFWMRKLNISIDKAYWTLGSKTCKESRLRELHFKVLHNIYPTNILLSKLGITINDHCTHCPGNIDFIEHFFFDCPRINKVWDSVKDKFFQKYSKRIQVSLDEALLGMIEKDGLTQAELVYINHLILIAKMSVGIFRFNKPIDIQFIFESECCIRKV